MPSWVTMRIERFSQKNPARGHSPCQPVFFASCYPEGLFSFLLPGMFFLVYLLENSCLSLKTAPLSPPPGRKALLCDSPYQATLGSNFSAKSETPALRAEYRSTLDLQVQAQAGFGGRDPSGLGVTPAAALGSSLCRMMARGEGEEERGTLSALPSAARGWTDQQEGVE